MSDSVSDMKQIGVGLVLLLSWLSWLLAATLVPTRASGTEAPLLSVTAEQREALGVTVAAALPADIVSGPLLPARITVPNAGLHVVVARASAVVLDLPVSVGDAVEPGQTLARLESPALVGLQQEFLQALSQRDLGRELAEREEALAAEGVIAGRRGLETRARLAELESILEARRRALLLAGLGWAEVQKLAVERELYANLVVRSSVSGVVLEQYVRVGERVDAGAPLYRVGQLRELGIEVHVPLERARGLVVGGPIEVVGGAGGAGDSGDASARGVQAGGRIVAIGSEVHPLDQGIVVRGLLEDPSGALRPGQFVRVQLSTPVPQRTAHLVPAASVVRIDDRSWVFIVEEGGFRASEVEILGGTGRSRIVHGPGLERARVVVRGTATLKALWLSETSNGEGG